MSLGFYIDGYVEGLIFSRLVCAKCGKACCMRLPTDGSGAGEKRKKRGSIGWPFELSEAASRRVFDQIDLSVPTSMPIPGMA